ncbi:hypothetical protein [Pseudooctadecabacter sp.]|uniref:hypothetical protein n=1 Tax=Pseudooctadecabacter sp. TaxID=1966338 RepID=UPI0035C78C5E
MSGPPLEDGEQVVFDHVPSLRRFKRTALLMIVLTLFPVAAFLIVFPDTFWPAVPLFVTTVLLAQERVRLGRHRAWITNRRIIQQGGHSIALDDVENTRAEGNGVRLQLAGNIGKGPKLFYPEDGAALARAIMTAKGDP